MASITCFVGRLRNTIALDELPLTLTGWGIPDFYRTGSRISDTQAAIVLKMDRSRSDNSLIPGSQLTTALSLHNALARLTQNGTARPVNRIGLIVADRFVHARGILGLMFDRGFNPSGMDPVGPVFNNVPREGCAIFLDAIRDIRGVQREFHKEVAFTAIHEIGHIFNLQHVEQPKNFLSTSMQAGTFGPQAFQFTADHRAFLRRADTDDHVLPGGSNFGNTGAFGPVANDPFKKPGSGNDLSLEIAIGQSECWFFEPLELDVQLTAKKKTYVVPNEIDPGYERFVIYITRPDGTTFRYRSPRIYCKNYEDLTVSPSQPFLRDISIFGQSGGYTFQQPGEYTIRCAFDTGLGFHLLSNTVSLLVKEPRMHKQADVKMMQVLTSARPALLLYHRSGNFNQTTFEALYELTRSRKATPLAGNIQYALARFKAQRGRQNKEQRKLVDRLVNKALDSNALSKARKKNCMLVKEQYRD